MTEGTLMGSLDRDGIEKIAQEQGFRDPRLVEKFIRLLEVMSCIQRELSDCAAKGGTAMPFNLQDSRAHRLSVDIDLVTGMSRDQVVKIMEKILDNLEFLTEYKGPHIPKNPDKRLPLLTYFCKYVSIFGDDAEMKIEIFHDTDMNTPILKTVEPGIIAGIRIDFPATVYDSSSLIGDKLTTLAFKTIGIPSEKNASIPKQIYDIASLLKSVSHLPSIMKIIDVFEKTVDNEISYFVNEPPKKDAILEDLDKFPNELFIKDQFRLELGYAGKLTTFATNMLGRQNYIKKRHIADILLVKAIIKIILKKISGADTKIITSLVKELLTGLDDISRMDLARQNVEFKNILRKYGKASETGKVMKNLSPEQAFLYDYIIKVEKIQGASDKPV